MWRLPPPTLPVRSVHAAPAGLVCGLMGTRASRLTLLASAVCIVAGVLALYVRSAVLDREHFADRAVPTLAQDEVAEEIAASASPTASSSARRGS